MTELSFDIVDLKNKEENSIDSTLESIYHKGQQKIWDGREVLDSLIKKHGKPKLTVEERHALINILTLILWGELAAWKTSAILSAVIDERGAKLAATSQTHDEARHFYVMLDYMEKVLNYSPNKDQYLTECAKQGLNEVVKTKSLPKKLLGMQLMVEPVAITIFKKLREKKVEPILSELLLFYERDEARHIALGVKHLPKVISSMTWTEIINLFVWQCKMLKFEVDGLKSIAHHFDCLGIQPIQVLEAAEHRQKLAAQDMVDNLGWKLPIVSVMEMFLRAYIDFTWFNKSYASTVKSLVVKN